MRVSRQIPELTQQFIQRSLNNFQRCRTQSPERASICRRVSVDTKFIRRTCGTDSQRATNGCLRDARTAAATCRDTVRRRLPRCPSELGERRVFLFHHLPSRPPPFHVREGISGVWTGQKRDSVRCARFFAAHSVRSGRCSWGLSREPG